MYLIPLHNVTLRKIWQQYSTKISLISNFFVEGKIDIIISLSLHTAEKTFPCDLCGEGYTSPYLLKVHKNKDHFNNKPYACEVCGKAFNQKSCLRNHIRTHTGEKPFICNFCGKGFAQQNQLSTHIRKHTGMA